MHLNLPAEYNKEIYLHLHADLQKAGFDDAGLEQHYKQFGINEGRISNNIHSRKDFLALIPTSATILEIMPGYSPVIIGENVKYFDTHNRNQLVAGAKKLNIEIDTLPNIDYVSAINDLSIIKEKFDVVVSSHDIGRHPNLVNHLQQIETLLNPGGMFFCIIPDNRYTRHFYNNETSTTSILAKYFTQTNTIPLEETINYMASTTHYEAQRHWAGDHGLLHTDLAKRVQNALQDINTGIVDSQSIQSNFFTPTSFQNIHILLSELHFTGLKLIRNYHTKLNNFEFFVVMQKPI